MVEITIRVDPTAPLVYALSIIDHRGHIEQDFSGDVVIDFLNLVSGDTNSGDVNLGQRHLENLLVRQGLIPIYLRSWKLVFTGTLWLDEDNFEFLVPIMYWAGNWKNGHWVFDWISCEDDEENYLNERALVVKGRLLSV